ncbi:DUF4232 domain-containing protein [Trebonia kvetii]|uniref:DUF4232 domain-containing protein n=1 Tax=Trebonia kvetii TaxID=2480626 RepID=A0A6P2BW14_9ACTN|nr:DUF4232 domain-containing protein [Trebonia kvetii]TVZ03319.1 DUF4232 domain-containing protein [Trebonia kvetii]
MFKRNIRRAAIASASALTLGIGAAVWATSASASAAAPAASTPRCTAADLSVWLNLGEANAAAGTAFYPLEFTNVSNHACHLFGYPGVSALNGNGKQLGNAAGRNARFKPTTVTIAAGGTAHADLGWVDVGNFPASKCKPTTATIVRAFPPGATHSDRGFAPLRSCSVKGETYIFVTTVRPGPNADD